jgi:hypothetical protein
MDIDVPDRFPEGCHFGSSFGGDEYVRYPNGQWYRLDETSIKLIAIRSMVSKGTSSNEEYFQSVVDNARKNIERI